MRRKNFEHDVESDYPHSFTHRDNEKDWALWKAQKRASIRNIRLNATSIINDLQNLLELYDKEHNERMYEKTMVLLTSLNNFIVESYNKDSEEVKRWAIKL